MVGRSKVWRLSHFANRDRTEVQCDLCPSRIKFVGNTTNIARHLELKHPTEYAALTTTDGGGGGNNPGSTAGGRVNANHSTPTSIARNNGELASPTSSSSSSSSMEAYNKILNRKTTSQKDENVAIRRILQIHNRELQKLKAEQSHQKTCPAAPPEFIIPHESKNLIWNWHSPLNNGKSNRYHRERDIVTMSYRIIRTSVPTCVYAKSKLSHDGTRSLKGSFVHRCRGLGALLFG